MAKRRRGTGNQGLPKPRNAPVKSNPSPANPTKARLAVREEFSIHSGPLPPPDTIQRYEDLLPGAAQTIFQNWNKEIEHRQNYINEGQRLEARDSARGMYCALTTILAGMGLAGFAAMHGQTAVAIAAIGTPIVGVASSMILGRYRSSK